MDEQTQSDSSGLSIEERIEAQMFGDEQPSENVPAEASGEQVEEGQEPEPTLETVDFEGKTYQVPPELKAAVLRQSDYTQKTQEVAELRRSVEAQAESVKAQAEFEKAIEADRQQLQAISLQLKQYRELDWTGLDTESILKVQRMVDALKEQQKEAQDVVQQKRQQFESYQAQTLKQQIAATESFMSKVVPQWNAEKGTELTQYLANQGFGPETIRNIVRDPVMTHTFWKAQQFDKAKAGQTTTKPAPMVKPGASNPALSQKMSNLNLRKQIKAAPTSRDKATLIARRLEQMV